MRRLVVGISGASGTIYGIRLLEILKEAKDVETHLVLSDSGKQNIRLETDYTPEAVEALATARYQFNNVAAAIASGSFKTMGMVVVPCSMKTLSSIALSASGNLLTRAADVTLKERRRLVIVPRETPLHLGHLRLMTQATEMGAILVPPMPAFYNRPKTIDDLVNQTVSRILDLMGIELSSDIAERWTGPKKHTKEA